jgi:hypothetical protein
MNDAVKDEQIANPLEITKERLREWSACTSGYGWFLEKFPQGGMFGEVYNALRDDRRYDDSDWLINHVFAELDTGTKAVQLVSITGADKAKIEQQVKDYGGKEGEVATTGYRANAATTGEVANAATTGNWANAATTGDRANAATTGNWANAATTGNWANAATTGDWANAATTGDWANAATTGYRANAATTGDWANAATTGEHAVAAAIGTEGKAKASVGGAIVLCYRNDNGHLIHIRASKVGENGIKPDVWYSLDEIGEFIESEA